MHLLLITKVFSVGDAGLNQTGHLHGNAGLNHLQVDQVLNEKMVVKLLGTCT